MLQKYLILETLRSLSANINLTSLEICLIISQWLQFYFYKKYLACVYKYRNGTLHILGNCHLKEKKGNSD